jgi:hypothetical protein
MVNSFNLLHQPQRTDFRIIQHLSFVRDPPIEQTELISAGMEEYFSIWADESNQNIGVSQYQTPYYSRNDSSISVIMKSLGLLNSPCPFGEWPAKGPTRQFFPILSPYLQASVRLEATMLAVVPYVLDQI